MSKGESLPFVKSTRAITCILWGKILKKKHEDIQSKAAIRFEFKLFSLVIDRSWQSLFSASLLGINGHTLQ